MPDAAGHNPFGRFRDQTRSPMVVLTNHLFRRFFDNEFVSESGESHLGFLKILAVLAIPGIYYVLYSYPTYDLIGQVFPNLYESYSLRDQFGLITLAMMIVSLVSVLEWDGLFLDRLDFLTLVPLPLSVRQIFTAKIQALVLFLAAVTAAVGGSAAVFYPAIASSAHHVSIVHYGFWVLAHFLSVAAGCAFVFLAIIALRGLLSTFLSARWSEMISPYLQGTLIAALLVSSFSLPKVFQDVPRLIRTGGVLIRYLPPVWFLGLYRVLLGYHQPGYGFLARRALEGLACAAGIAVITYLASYRRHMQGALEVAQPSASEPWAVTQSVRRSVANTFLPRPHERASFKFIFDTLRGSHKHRLLFSAYTGVGAAVVLESLAALPTGPVIGRVAILLSVPLLLSFFVLSGMRIVFELPAEVGASWIFQLTENKTSAEMTSGIRKALAVAGIAPLITLAVPIWLLHLSAAQAAAAFLLDTFLALLMVEALLTQYQKIPFTCTFHATQARSVIVWAICWALFTSYAYGLAKAEGWVLHHPVPLAIFLGLLILGVAYWRVRNQEFLLEGRPFVFTEMREPAVQTLDLNHCALHPDTNSGQGGWQPVLPFASDAALKKLVE